MKIFRIRRIGFTAISICLLTNFLLAQDSLAKIQSHKWDLNFSAGYGFPIAKSSLGEHRVDFPGSTGWQPIINEINSTLGQGFIYDLNVSRILFHAFSVDAGFIYFSGINTTTDTMTLNRSGPVTWYSPEYSSRTFLKINYPAFKIGFGIKQYFNRLSFKLKAQFLISAWNHITSTSSENSFDGTISSRGVTTWDYFGRVGFGMDFSLTSLYRISKNISMGLTAYSLFQTYAPGRGTMLSSKTNGIDNTPTDPLETQIYFEKNITTSPTNSTRNEQPLHYYPLSSGGIMFSFNYTFGK